jgi:uncharacterized membrane protein
MDDLAIARALHVLGVVVWIGGVAMVTAVILPATQRRELGADPVAAFSAIERRFGHWARGAVLLVGATGFYMTARFDLWDRFRSATFWWMHAMLLVWLIFTFILFVAEPLYLHRRFDAWAAERPEAALAWLKRGHWILLTASLLTVLGAVAGSHGASLF